MGLFLVLSVVLFHLIEPEIGKVAILPSIKPRPSTSIMHGLRLRGGIVLNDPVVPFKEVPHKGNGPNLLVLQPLEPMEESPGLSVYGLGVQCLVLGVSTVVKHHGGPVLPRVHSLDRTVHLSGLFGGVIVLNTHDCVFVIDEIGELLDVGKVEEITVDEHGPTLVIGQVWSEETRERELSALKLASLSPIQTFLPEI